MVHAKDTLQADNGDVLTLWSQQVPGASLQEIWNISDALQQGDLVRILDDWQGLSSKISFVYPLTVCCLGTCKRL